MSHPRHPVSVMWLKPLFGLRHFFDLSHPLFSCQRVLPAVGVDIVVESESFLQQHRAQWISLVHTLGMPQSGQHLELTHPAVRLPHIVGVGDSLLHGEVAQVVVAADILSVEVAQRHVALALLLFLFKKTLHGSHKLLKDADEIVSL